MSWGLSMANRTRLFSRNCLFDCCLRGRMGFSDGVKILGIETSCDDTGIAIVDGNGKILGEALNSQQSTHLQEKNYIYRYGGIIPPVARELHRKNITDVCEKALRDANLRVRDVDAVAVTVKPGLPLSLMIGRNFGQYLSKIGNKPLIPIHHMEAHALTARMSGEVEFPFLTLLISGGHCLLALVKDVADFYLLGTSIDDAPGEALDKTARKLKLRNIPEYADKNGGAAIELAASRATNPFQFEFPALMSHYKDCNFSFAGLKNSVERVIGRLEEEHEIVGDKVVPDIENLCAGFQLCIAKHICHRTKRAIMFLDRTKLIPENKKTLVISGGVACNNFIAKSLQLVCDEMGYRFVRPPPKFCMDNGIMIAWNGLERWNADVGVLRDPLEIEKVEFESRAPLGINWIDRVREEDITCRTVRSKELYP
ncbi:probable tRNA N6-adenosine threonylcarbamoyltransferase, mitochondrial isoform X2 [Fopius arisanus]|uniref:N(6)-L-threonylcarbamoyladenine synthase n=1 Tax=Fopius arisanus TaxID=64838 RepID=A0A9R1T7J3_9HYME|nr:PREDICTED: probable tRNA N6-adenosine threonylcarbamoyltransferase, mitochondrial isoform X2 [Fopius arisanus]